MLGHRDWAKTTPRSDPAWVVFGALLLFHAWHNYVWLGNDWPFFFITDRVPMERAWQWQKIILRDDWLPSILQRFYRDEDSGIYNLTVGAVYLFSASVRTTILSTNLPYLAIGIWFTYRLGARMAGSAWGGVFSAAIFGLIPSVYAASRRVSHEFAVMCLTVMAVWFLLTSEGFLKRRQSILFGLTVGWGMMIKYVMAVGLAGPVALCLLRAFFPQGKVPLAIWRTEKALRLANLGWAVLAAVAIMGIKYSNPVSVWHYAMRPQWERSSEPWYTWENLRVTTVGLVEDHFGLLFFLVFCFGVAIFLSRKWVEGPNKAVLLAWFLVPWLSIILMSHHKWDRGRYLLPVIPALALMAGIGWSRFAGGRYRWARLGIVVLLGLTQFYDFSFNDRPKGRTLAGLKYYGPRDPLLKASTGFGPSMERRIARILSHMKGKRTVVLTSQEELLDFEMWRSFHAHFRETLGFESKDSWFVAFSEVRHKGAADHILARIRAADVLIHCPTAQIRSGPDGWMESVLQRMATVDFQHRVGENVRVVLKFAEFAKEESRRAQEDFRKAIGDFVLEERIRLLGNTAFVYHRRPPEVRSRPLSRTEVRDKI